MGKFISWMVRWGASEGDIWGDEEKENHVCNEGNLFLLFHGQQKLKIGYAVFEG